MKKSSSIKPPEVKPRNPIPPELQPPDPIPPELQPPRVTSPEPQPQDPADVGDSEESPPSIFGISKKKKLKRIILPEETEVELGE